MNFSKKTILITGGTGYIGSHAVVAFEQAGYKTVIIDNLINSSKNVLKGIEKILGYSPDFHQIDIRDREELEKIFQKYSFDAVIHFAGLKAVGQSCEDIYEYQDNNVTGSIILFGIMQKFGVKKIIFSSSATVYSVENISPFTEEMPTSTTNPYGTSKLVIEKLLQDYVTHAGWSVSALRYFNPVGAHPSGYIGEAPVGIPNNLLPYVLDVAGGKREYVAIFGDDYDTPDGTGVRDYIDINDLIDAHICSYQKLTKGFFLYNIGSGKGTSVLDIIRIVADISGRNIPYKIVNRRTGDIATVFSSPKKANEELGWKSTRSIHDSVSTTWKFINKNS